MSSLQFGWVPHGGTATEQETLHEEALAIAAKADAVIFCGGLTHHDDTEGKDRTHITLPDGQDALIDALLKVNANTVITLVGGSPVTMPWVDRAKAILWLWYAGMEGGHAAARILFGEVSPSGKLPFTFPVSLEESPAHKLGTYTAEKSIYNEGLFVGYRYHVSKDEAPLFAFGHGLSYANFDYQNLRIEAGEGDSLCVAKLDIVNTGKVAGKEVVQLYIEDVECSVERPKLELKGFQKVSVKPGESVSVSFEIKAPDLCYFDDQSMQWKAEPGAFLMHVGAASDDIRLIGKFEYRGQPSTGSACHG